MIFWKTLLSVFGAVKCLDCNESNCEGKKKLFDEFAEEVCAESAMKSDNKSLESCVSKLNKLSTFSDVACVSFFFSSRASSSNSNKLRIKKKIRGFFWCGGQLGDTRGFQKVNSHFFVDASCNTAVKFRWGNVKYVTVVTLKNNETEICAHNRVSVQKQWSYH